MTRGCCSSSGLGSPTHSFTPESFTAYTESYEWRKIYGRELLYSGPMFTHQLSHMWIDFRGIRDKFMRVHDSDYFENSRHATYVQQEYAIINPMNFVGYGEHCWGFTASDGPGWTKRSIDGVQRKFFDYLARGVPFGPDDGTVSPWVVVASLPFAPEIVVPTVRNFGRMNLGMTRLFRSKPRSIKPTWSKTVPRDDRLVLSLRHGPGSGHFDDQRLPDGLALEHHSSMPADRDRIAQGGVCWGLARLRCLR